MRPGVRTARFRRAAQRNTGTAIVIPARRLVGLLADTFAIYQIHEPGVGTALGLAFISR